MGETDVYVLLEKEENGTGAAGERDGAGDCGGTGAGIGD